MSNLQQVQERVALVLAKAEKMYNIDLSKVSVRYDLKGRAAGTASIKQFRGSDGTMIPLSLSMRFNVTMINGEGFDHVINDTVPHEIAHIVCMAKNIDRGHGSKWRRVCIELGGSGKTYHSEEVVYAKGKTYEYTCTAGNKVTMSETRHKKIQRGIVYSMKRGGRIDKSCAFELVGISGNPINKPTTKKATPMNEATEATEATPATTPAAEVPATPKAKGKPSKAVQIREAIAKAKLRDFDRSVVVSFGVDDLGMTRALARKYVNENWNKVEG